MATVTLLSAVTTDTVGTGQAVSGPCTVQVDGDGGGGETIIEASIDDVSANYQQIGVVGTVRGNKGGLVHCHFLGSYYLRARHRGCTGTAARTARANN